MWYTRRHNISFCLWTSDLLRILALRHFLYKNSLARVLVSGSKYSAEWRDAGTCNRNGLEIRDCWWWHHGTSHMECCVSISLTMRLYAKIHESLKIISIRLCGSVWFIGSTQMSWLNILDRTGPSMQISFICFVNRDYEGLETNLV